MPYLTYYFLLICDIIIPYYIGVFNMSSRVVSFSVRRRRTKETALVNWYKNHSIAIGPDFSSLMLAAMKYYKEEVLDNGKLPG